MIITSAMPPLTITPTEPCSKCGGTRWTATYDVRTDGWRCSCGRVAYPVCVGGAWVIQYEPRLAPVVEKPKVEGRSAYLQREARTGPAARLRQAREARGWDRRTLAEKSTVTIDTIKGYESGRRSGYRGTWLLLADALGMRVEELAG